MNTISTETSGLNPSLSDTKVPNTQAPLIIRRHASGDFEQLIKMQCEFYGREFSFPEAIQKDAIEKPMLEFEKNFNPDHDGSWVAEIDGKVVGCVLSTKESEEVARLRQLFVDPSTRGLGLGKKLVDECIDFCRQKGFKRVMLYTNKAYIAAARVYDNAGFDLTKETQIESDGRTFIVQERTLDFEKASKPQTLEAKMSQLSVDEHKVPPLVTTEPGEVKGEASKSEIPKSEI